MRSCLRARTLPPSGLCSPAIMRMRLLLPEPFGPMSPMRSCAAMRRSRSAKSWVLPKPSETFSRTTRLMGSQRGDRLHQGVELGRLADAVVLVAPDHGAGLVDEHELARGVLHPALLHQRIVLLAHGTVGVGEQRK